MVGLKVGRVDTSRWNLFTSGVGLAVAVIACGPAIGTEDSDSNSGDASESAGSSDASDTNSTQGADCLSDADCGGYGYRCVDNVCEYDCTGCGCGQPPPPGTDVRCPGSLMPYYDCYTDYDCGEGQICEYGSCQTAPIDCSGIPVSDQTIALQFSTPSAAPVVALAFANVASAPEATLLVARGTAIEAMNEGGVGTVIVQTPSDLVTFAAADLDGDAVVDVVTAELGDTAMLRLWHGEMDGTFTATEIAQPLVDARALAIGDREGDLQLDVYAHVGRDVLVFPTAAGVPLGAAQPLLTGQVDAMALIDVANDGVSDVAFGDASAFWLYRELLSPDPVPIGEAQSPLIDTLVVADFSGDGEAELAGLAAPAALATFFGEVPTWPAIAGTLPAGYAAATAGDIDGDGREDLVIVEVDLASVLVRYGAAGMPEAMLEPYRCETRYDIELLGQRVAAGDADGDGRAEVAVADASQVVLVRI